MKYEKRNQFNTRLLGNPTGGPMRERDIEDPLERWRNGSLSGKSSENKGNSGKSKLPEPQK